MRVTPPLLVRNVEHPRPLPEPTVFTDDNQARLSNERGKIVHVLHVSCLFQTAVGIQWYS